MRGQVKRLVAAFSGKDIRQIGAGDLQRIIAAMEVEGYEPKTMRNLGDRPSDLGRGTCSGSR